MTIYGRRNPERERSLFLRLQCRNCQPWVSQTNAEPVARLALQLTLPGAITTPVLEARVDR